MKRVIAVILTLLFLFSVTACSPGASEARKCLEDYQEAVLEGGYESAYDMLSSFDRGNITKEQFIQWQTLAAKLVKAESFKIDAKTDSFGKYEYKGAKFNKAFGFRVLRVQEELLPEITLQGYDSADYRIMVVEEEGSYKVALLIIQLEETIRNYQRQLEEKAE